ncbi:MAG: 16S rRNA (uracil(1498)-N(3))-methyltransferase [Deltaproteobacteria bacterium]|nr:MAG: 16S rRNA (uracil(1498)-N(3))-methyltransferase [Deltaproteobacteria bacterium]
MRRFLVDKIIPTTGLVSITGKEATHISRVLRMEKGDTLVIMDGKGNLFESTIENIHYKEVKVKINKGIPPLPSSPIEISLGQALIKSHPMDYLIQKTTELGISSIALFYSERTVIRSKPDHLRNKMDRWMEIMKSSCRQCGRATLPTLNPPLPFEEIIKNAPGKKTLRILLWENEDKTDLKKVLRSTRPLPHILTMVGPEGGFTGNEINLARQAGFKIVSLGKRILRTETAAVSLVSIIQYEWGDLNVSF